MTRKKNIFFFLFAFKKNGAIIRKKVLNLQKIKEKSSLFFQLPTEQESEVVK